VRRLSALAIGLAFAVCAASAAAGDWPQFGYDPARSSAPAGSTGITAANVGKLVRQQVKLDGIVDSSAVYLRGVAIGGATHDAFFVTTSYGRTIAVDADTGAVLWEYVPPGIAGWDHSARITTAAPAADPGRRFLYAAAPDGRIHKLAVADGSEVAAGGWPVAITLDPEHEKIGPGINVTSGLVLASTGGFIGDYPPYQGHVVAIDRATGKLLHVFNALCSNRHALIQPSSCVEAGAAIWGRGGVVVEPGSRRLLVATGNGAYDGRRNWGDSLLELSADAGKLLQAYTPRNASYLEGTDLDLGSASPAILTKNLVVQPGKDGKVRLLRLDRLNGRTRTAAHIQGGELQILPGPRSHQILTAPAVWHAGGRAWVFIGNYAATAGYMLQPGRKPRLRRVWQVDRGGSSPVVAGGLLYAFDPLAGGVHVYRPSTGTLVTTLPTGKGHWNSPIVADGRVAVPEGDSNDHHSGGVLDIFRLPGAGSSGAASRVTMRRCDSARSSSGCAR
jgi:outer membrane protein assembly factor BamB